MTTFRHRLMSMALGLGVAVIAALAPVSQAAVVPHTQNIYQDVNQLTAAGHTSLYIQQIAQGCYDRAIDYQLQQICQDIFLGQAQAMNNDRHLIYRLVGTYPNNFRLNAAERANVNLVDSFSFGYVTSYGGTESDFVGLLTVLLLDNGVYTIDIGGTTLRILPVGNGYTGAFSYGLYVTSVCQYDGFARQTRAYCASLNHTYGYERDTFENYVTFTQGTPFEPPSPPDPFNG